MFISSRIITRKKIFTSETRVQSAAYLPHTVLATPSQDSSMDHPFDTLLDQNNSTCLKAELNGNMWLQVVFTLAGSPFGHKVEVEVVVNHETDCASYAWTWSVGSICSQKHYLECRKSPLESLGQFGRCSVIVSAQHAVKTCSSKSPLLPSWISR